MRVTSTVRRTAATLRFLPLFILSAVLVPDARAWNPTGHMVIASMAYDQLPPDQRIGWVDLLKTHPDFEKWQATAPGDAPDFDLGRYLFMRASTWPDDIRKSGSPWDHPPWHHVDYPLHTPDYRLEPPPADVPNALTAIAACKKILAEPGSIPADRAASLSWLIHLVGDLQQPLHSANVVNAEFPAPDGDHNALLVFVSVAGSPITLHWLWDCLPGDFVDGVAVAARGKELTARFPRGTLPELTRATNPAAWSLEGRALAIDAAYLRGALAVAKDARDAPPLPPGYLSAARALADRRVALASYRLADTLSTLEP